MRIISGSLKGKKILLPKNNETRPLKDLVKESIFNVINHSKKLLIYPNPTNDILKIEIENFNGSFEAEFYDLTGKLLETTNNTSLSISQYQSGIYLLKVTYGVKVGQLKVIRD